MILISKAYNVRTELFNYFNVKNKVIKIILQITILNS